jgi:hypothetical protein
MYFLPNFTILWYNEENKLSNEKVKKTVENLVPLNLNTVLKQIFKKYLLFNVS